MEIPPLLVHFHFSRPGAGRNDGRNLGYCFRAQTTSTRARAGPPADISIDLERLETYAHISTFCKKIIDFNTTLCSSLKGIFRILQ